MVRELYKESCISPEEGAGHLMFEEIKEYSRQAPDWTWENHHFLVREFKFDSFSESYSFVGKVSALAEKEMHYPEIVFGSEFVRIILYTHTVDGLTENDFILATKIDRL